MPTCPDCGETLRRVDERIYLCERTGLYYSMDTRGKLRYPQLEPPKDLVKKKEQFKPVERLSDPTKEPISDKEMLNHPKFFQFCLHQYPELNPIEAIHQIRDSKDPSMMNIVRRDFLEWLQS